MNRRWHHRIPKKNPGKKAQTEFILLDKFSVADIRLWRDFQDQILKFHWDFYSTLAYQRSKIIDKIRQSLFDAAQKPFTFSKWQRALKYKYALEPFSVSGSLIDPGGRFNIGDLNPTQFRPFPALYLASDKNTALQELLSQKIDPGQEEERALDFALASPDSIANVSLSGSLESVINLAQPAGLAPFVDLIKDFSIPDYLNSAAKKIGLPEPELIRTVPKLVDSILDANWRMWPMQFDVPVASQIFGQLVADAGVGGIVYTSKFTGKDCLAVFPQNFDDLSGSFIQLDDEAPPEIKTRRLDAKSWDQLKRSK